MAKPIIAIVGRPNVGKSSILNTLLGQKGAIVSSKPQTTRTRIMGVLTEGGTQLVFTDTPGLHKPRNSLDKFMVRSVSESVAGVDACLLVTEAGREVSPEELELVEKFKALDIPAVLAINKTDTLKDKTILVLGVGGVGSYTVETLIRNPIKKIIIIDADVVDITNLNRQLFTNQNNIGLKKVDELEKRIKSINPYIEIKKIDKFIDENNIQLLFEEKVDYIVDACDSIKTKEILIKECLKRKIKFISCMGTAKKLDPTKLEITDIRKTSYDPLAKRIRKMVKDEKINGKIPVICSTEKPKEIKKLGSISFVPSVAGIYITSYIINDIIGEK